MSNKETVFVTLSYYRACVVQKGGNFNYLNRFQEATIESSTFEHDQNVTLVSHFFHPYSYVRSIFSFQLSAGHLGRISPEVIKSIRES